MTIDQPETHPANSVTLQKMMVEHVQPDIFNPPHHKLKPGIQSKLDALLKEYESQFAKDETSIRTTPDRLVIDYCTLNKVTRKFTWPVPKVEDIISKLNGARYFSTLDLRAGYHHIPLDKSSIPKTTFNSPIGKYEYIKVPFELPQAPAYFQE